MTSAQGTRSVLYNSVGNTLTRWLVDADAATLSRAESTPLPAVVQYGWAHPSGRHLYVCSSDAARGSRTISGETHLLTALRLGRDGALTRHGPARPLRQRPIHMSVDRAGRHALICYNAPSHLSVHRIEPDGTLGHQVDQPGTLLGRFAHQIQPTPSGKAALVVVRGNNPTRDAPAGDPGALELLAYDDGRLTTRASIMPGGNAGAGYGPRHAAFHPHHPWLYVLVELQNQLHMHRCREDVPEDRPSHIVPCTAAPPVPGVVQVAGAIHVHPRGHVLYASNRVSATTHPHGPFPFVAGENNIAVFALDPINGAPTPIQFVDPHGFHVRAFTIDPTGRLLIATSLAPMALRDGDAERIVPAGLAVFRIRDDGRLEFARRYDVETAPGVQQMWVTAMPLPQTIGSTA